MSKFKVGDRFKRKDNNESGKIYHVYEKTYDVLWDKPMPRRGDYFIEEADRRWTKIESHKNQVIDQMNAENDKVLSIAAGVDWVPLDNNEFPNPVKCFHTWRTVTLFTSTVEECSKCGVLRE